MKKNGNADGNADGNDGNVDQNENKKPFFFKSGQIYMKDLESVE